MVGELEHHWNGFLFGSTLAVVLVMSTSVEMALTVVWYAIAGSIILSQKGKLNMVFDSIEAAWRQYN